MLVAIIADIHDNEANLRKCLRWARGKKISELICCGDVTTSQTLGLMAELFAGPIHLVRGNMEIYDEAEVKAYRHIAYYGRTGLLALGGYQVGICHEPYWLADILKAGADYAFYGHTHKPWIEKQGQTTVANPGTLAGLFQRATFAVFNALNGQLELKDLAEL